MATLPKIVANNSVIQMPQSRVTAADIADPFDQVARALGGAAQQLRAKELDDAQSDGENAVFRTPDGQLQVKFRGNTSEVGRTYDRVAKQSYLARLSSDIRLSGSKLAVEAKGDPTAFRASWKGFRDHLISSAPRDVRGPVQTILDSEGGKFEFGVSEQKRQFDVTTGRENLKAEAAALDDEATALALKGGSGTPEYLERMTRIRSILTEMTGNPEYGVGEKEAQISLKRMESKHIGFGLLGQVGRTFETGGLVAARKLADSVMTDESLTLSPAERRQFSREMNERIGDMMAVRQADLEPVKKQASQITERLKLGMGLDDNDIDETARKLAAGGDAAGAVKLINERAFARFAGMSDPDQLKVLEQAKAGNPTISKVPPVAVDAAREFLRGRTDKNASHIDGMDGGFSVKVSQLLRAAPPEIREGLGIYSGYRSPERQAELWQGALKKYGSVAEARKWVAPPEGVEGSKGSQHTHGKAADLGYNGQSLKNAPPNVVKWLHDNAGQFGLKFPLGNENWHIEDDGTRGGQSSGTDYSGLDLELVKEWQTEVTTDTADLFGEIKAGVLRSERPSNEDLGVLYRQMAVINDNDLKEEITRFLGAERFAAT